MKKLSLVLALLACSSVGVLVACGDDTGGGSTDDGDGATSGGNGATSGGNGGCTKASDCSALNCDGTETRICVNGACATQCPSGT